MWARASVVVTTADVRPLGQRLSRCLRRAFSIAARFAFCAFFFFLAFASRPTTRSYAGRARRLAAARGLGSEGRPVWPAGGPGRVHPWRPR